VKGEDLTAFDLAWMKGNRDCMDVLRQHGGMSAVECKALDEAEPLFVMAACDSSALEARFWITDEVNVQKRAADIVSTIVRNAISVIDQRVHGIDDDSDNNEQTRQLTQV